MATWFNENFTDTDLTLLTAHTPDSGGGSWSMLIGPSPQIFATAVAGKSLVGPGPTGAYSVARAPVIAPNADAKIPFGYHVYGVTSFAGLGLRVSGTGTSTRGYAGIINTASSKAEIWKLDSNGQLTGAPLVSSAAIVITAGDSGFGEFGVVGNTLTLTVYGATISYTDTTSPISAAGYVTTIFAAAQGNGIFLDFMTPQDQAASPAAAATLSGPSTGNVGSPSTVFTVGANGTTAGIVRHTPNDASGGGSFAPAFLDLASGTTGTFTYTAVSNGVKSIGTTNNGGLTNPAPVSYTAAATGAPAMGVASFVSATAAAINLSSTAAAGGTAPLTYQWHRSTTANFAPGAGTVLAGATALTLADSASLTAGTPYYYVCRATDASALTSDSNQVAGALKAATLKLGFIGDSITFGYGLSAGQDPASQIVPILKKTFKNRDVTATNSAVSGSKSSQWVPGQSNLIAAKSAFATAGVTHVHCMLGANDAAVANLVSAATFKSNLQSTITDLTGAGYKVILSYPTYLPAGANSGATTAASVALAQSYQAQIDSLIDNVNVLRGDVLAFNYFMDNLGEYQADMTHPTAAGAAALATMWARAIDRSVLDAGAAPALTTRTVTVTGLKIDVATVAANLAGLKVSFRDAAAPDLPGALSYQSATETTDGAGTLTFTCGSSLAAGATGWVDIKGAGVHYCGPVAVS